MSEKDGATAEERSAENQQQNQEGHEERSHAPSAPSEEQGQPAGGLRVEERTSAPRRSLADEFRAAGFPGEVAEVPFDAVEERAVTWTPSMDLLNQPERQAGSLPYDQRFAWPALPRVGVDSDATSVLVLSQTARALAPAANVVRAVDAVTAKPETGSTVNLVTGPLKQVANIQTNIPNIVLEQAAINTVIENDLRLALFDGLDKVVLDTTAASGFQAPGTDPLLVSIRKAMTTLFAAGYNPDTLILTPANAEALDTLVSGITGGANDYVFAPAQFAPDRIFGLQRRVSKTVAAAIVMDSQAFGKLYTSPVRLARFEADSGTTNRQNVRMELNACCGVERQTAAIRIAAS